jgi:hypothetical protein
MQHQAVTSSAIVSVAHEGDTLEVLFRSGQRYQYAGVSPELFAELLAAPSIGRALQQTVIGAGLKHTRLEPQKEAV